MIVWCGKKFHFFIQLHSYSCVVDFFKGIISNRSQKYNTLNCPITIIRHEFDTNHFAITHHYVTENLDEEINFSMKYGFYRTLKLDPIQLQIIYSVYSVVIWGPIFGQEDRLSFKNFTVNSLLSQVKENYNVFMILICWEKKFIFMPRQNLCCSNFDWLLLEIFLKRFCDYLREFIFESKNCVQFVRYLGVRLLKNWPKRKTSIQPFLFEESFSFSQGKSNASTKFGQ